MLKIDRAAVNEVAGASGPGDLVARVHDAVRLEFATIPPYLTAMLSLKPGRNRDIWWAIHDVVVDEMLHLIIGCNLLNALGARPALDGADFVPRYPGPLPLGIGDDLVVGLEPFSRELMERVFMRIEEPEDPLIFRQASAPPEFATIGEFYRTLSETLLALPGPLMPGDPARQVVAPHWYGTDRLFPIRTTKDAARAVSLIVEEGEGTRDSPVDPDGDIAHYYRFAAIAKGRRLVRDPSAPAGYSYTGAPYPFDPDGVWPLTPNQRAADLDPASEAWRRARQFQVTFTRLLSALQQCVDGRPGRLDAAMGIMFELKLAGQMLAATPVVCGGAPTGRNAGPVFVRETINR
ncbi:ferritin-like protein [Nonomuraea sp. NPDC050404]|uniref:ferritin-like domain-containing protein n=1 Tax=Nonomuraea sp. NPDC050404 TaxID=3155783 RepID=UPI003408DDCB